MNLPAVPVPPEPPAVPTPRLRFVRWLVDTGRLSEWPDAHYRNGVVRAHVESRDAALADEGLTLSSAGPGGVQR